jgi:hypothetical protein
MALPSIAAAAFVATPALAGEKFEEFVPIVEINATDGDIGFHVLLDGDGWNVAKIYDSEWDRMLKVRGTDDLDEQGITELFIESSEPLCWDDGEVDPEDIVTLAEFIDRFEAGMYHARGYTLEGDMLHAHARLTHNLPAAPANVEVTFEMDEEDDDIEVEISWEGGDDLGNCAFDDVDITPPGDVVVTRWEIVVEPEEDEIPKGMAISKFMVQLPGDVDELEVEVSEDFIEAYLEAGVTTFKYEIGAREASGNQTFTEGEFEIELED